MDVTWADLSAMRLLLTVSLVHRLMAGYKWLSSSISLSLCTPRAPLCFTFYYFVPFRLLPTGKACCLFRGAKALEWLLSVRWGLAVVELPEC